MKDAMKDGDPALVKAGNEMNCAGSTSGAVEDVRPAKSSYHYSPRTEIAMADVRIDKGRTAPTEATVPDVWRSFRSEVDRLFDRFGVPNLRRLFDAEQGWQPMSAFGFSSPPIDMSEDEKAYQIAAELPSLDAKDVEVSVSDDDMLVIRGEKRREKEEENKDYHFSERSYGSFRRAFELPAGVDRDKIAADFSKGVLTIKLPKTADARKRAKTIEVKSS
jgi:HSP20 family protein